MKGDRFFLLAIAVGIAGVVIGGISLWKIIGDFQP